MHNRGAAPHKGGHYGESVAVGFPPNLDQENRPDAANQ
jgi:hypothetical protein